MLQRLITIGMVMAMPRPDRVLRRVMAPGYARCIFLAFLGYGHLASARRTEQLERVKFIVARWSNGEIAIGPAVRSLKALLQDLFVLPVNGPVSPCLADDLAEIAWIEDHGILAREAVSP